jgi:hypothetical protein
MLVRTLFLLALLLGAPWVGRNVLGTVSWRELSERTRDRLFELVNAAGPFADPAVSGSPDFDQAWGSDDSAGPARRRTRITFRPGGSGSARLSVELVDAASRPQATIRIDALGPELAAFREIAAGLESLFREYGVSLRPIQERELVRILHGESYEVPPGRVLTIHELGMLAAGPASMISSQLVVSVDGAELFSHGFGGSLPASGLRVFVGDDLEYSLSAVRPVRAGERVSLREDYSGQKVYLLGFLSQ